MKKIIFLLLALLTIVLLVSCGSDVEKTPDATENETVANNGGEDTPAKEEAKRLSDEEKAKYFKFVEFELTKEPFRDVIVDYMRKQSNLEWVCSEDFSVSEKWAYWGISLNFKKGVTYRGIPYADTKVSYNQFKNALVDGTYTSASDKWEDVYGVQCISSIMNCIQQFDPTVAGTSNVMMPSYSTFEAKICGEYKIPDTNKTIDIINANGEDVIYEAYGQLKKGDIIMTKNDSEGTSHFRVLVEDPSIYKNGAGKVIPSRCSVKTIEQTNAFDSQRNDGVKTTWFVDHIYSFKTLIEQRYIPLTLESYSKSRSEMEVPYIALDKDLDPTLLSKKSFNSAVKSNFPLRYVQIDILDEASNLVTTKYKMNMEDSKTVVFRNCFSTLFDGLTSGSKYTLVVSAGIAIDSCELTRVEFTLG